MFKMVNDKNEYIDLVKNVKGNFGSEDEWLDFFEIIKLNKKDEDIADLFTNDGSAWVIAYAPKINEYPHIVYFDFKDLAEKTGFNLHIFNWVSLKELGISK